MKLMLAAKFPSGDAPDLSKLRYPLMASPKLDGIRAYVNEHGVVMSRDNKPIPNRHVHNLFGKLHLTGVDGELIVGNPTAHDCFRNTYSGVMRVDGEPNVYFHIFDLIGSEKPFWSRLLQSGIKAIAEDRAGIVPHVEIEDGAKLLEFQDNCLSCGYEGVMLRDPYGPYKHGRSTFKEGYLIKLKLFEDSEAVIIGGIELQHNLNEKDKNGKRTGHKDGKVAGGVLGALIVKDVKTGIEFEVGTGFKYEDRVSMWESLNGLIGKQIVYKFFPIGVKDKPRHPVFKGFREGNV